MASISTNDRIQFSKNSFCEVNPLSESASAPSSTPLQKMAYDVYIICDCDVMYGVALNIYEVLCVRELRVLGYKSEWIEGVDSARQETLRSCSLCIAIFPPRFAESSQCLEELSCMLKTGTPIIPVFYNVNPYDLRWVVHGEGIYTNAFLMHEQSGRYSLEKLQEWKMALYKVSLIWGVTIYNENQESMMLKTIVNNVLDVLQTVVVQVAKYPVDLQEAVADFEMTISQTQLQMHPIKKLPYDVFISHRGVDVQVTLASSIYDVLLRGEMGLRVFLDSRELQVGDFIPAGLLQAMRSASLTISIFSPRYAESLWCLEELSFMRNIGTPVIPVFFLVQPDDLRRVTEGKYADHFLEHEKKGSYSLQKLEEWKKALYDLSFVSGFIINNEE